MNYFNKFLSYLYFENNQKNNKLDSNNIKLINFCHNHLIIIKINKKLSTFINNPLDIINLLDNNNIISGSFILQIINKQNFNNSDLDLYINPNKLSEFENIIYNNEYKLSTNTVDKYNNNFYISQNNQNNIFEVKTFIKNDIKIDLIINYNSILEIKNFDLKILKNYFNGRQIFMFYPDEVNNKEENINKEYANKYFSNNTPERIVKYFNRGYNFYLYNNN